MIKVTMNGDELKTLIRMVEDSLGVKTAILDSLLENSGITGTLRIEKSFPVTKESLIISVDLEQ
jgi:hypothetical protein